MLDMNNTLLNYALSEKVTAFSTTRISPFELSAEEVAAMGAYAAFNVTDYCGDAPERVERNKQWLCDELHLTKEQLWLPRQTHTANVQCIDSHFVSLGTPERKAALQNVDALITNLPQQCIGVSTADCVPLLIYDEQNAAIAAVHAGWRGTQQRIVQRTLEAMGQKYGTSPNHCKVVVGPSISVDAFEVGDEVVSAFMEVQFPETIVLRHYAKPHIDLWAANVFLLEEMGVDIANVMIANVCTYAHVDTFFSARRLGINSGRMFTGICLH